MDMNTTIMQRTVVLLNIQARQVEPIIQEVKQACSPLCVSKADIIEVKPQELEEVVMKVLQEGVTRLIIGGGDGSIVTVARHIAHSSVELGIIPLGTSNNIARSLSISPTWQEAIQQITTGTIRKVHLAQVNGVYFFNVASLGVSTYIARHVSNKSKQLFGRLAYLTIGTRLFFKHEPFVCTIQTPSEVRQIVTHELVIANGKYHGMRPVSEDASLQKRFLTIMAFGIHKSRWEHLRNMFLYLFGLHEEQDDTLMLEVESAMITTEPSKPIEADGEEIARTPAQFSIIPNAISVIVPKEVQKL